MRNGGTASRGYTVTPVKLLMKTTKSVNFTLSVAVTSVSKKSIIIFER